MGTSLSGLTPATTFDGLLKTSDNDAIGTGLKTIGTGDGTDSVLQLSDSELNVAGQFNVDTGNALNTINLRGDSLVINQIYQANEVTYNSIAMVNSSGIRLNNGSSTTLVARSGNVGIGGITNVPTARLQVKGSGATSATTSLLVQNSAGTELLNVADDGNIYSQYLRMTGQSPSPLISVEGNAGKAIRLGNEGYFSSFNYIDLKTWDGSAYSEAMRITGNTDQFVGIGESTPTARLHVKGSGNDNTTTSLLVQNSDGTDLLKVLDTGATRINTETLSSTIIGKNGTGGGFIVDAGKVNNIRVDVNGVAINSTTSANTSFKVKGSGATSATTALLVQNSAGTELMKVRDDGYTDIGVNKNIAVANYNDIFIKAGGTYFRDISNNYHAAITNDGAQFGLGYTGPDAGVRLQVKGSGNDATTTALLVQNSDGDDMLSVKDDLSVVFNSTITSASSTLRFDVGGVGTIRMNSDKVAIGGNTTPTARLHVKGSGATSATTALLVQNSAGTDSFKVLDNGEVVVPTTSSFKVSSFSIQLGRIYPTTQDGDLGWNASTSYHFRNIYSKGVTHITDNTTSSTTLDASAKLQVDSTTKGFLPPRMTETERDAISSPAAGLMIYNTTTNTAECWNGSAWMPMF